jgi:hypothetical protein
VTTPVQQRQLTAAQLTAIVALLHAQAVARQQLTQAAVAAAVAAFKGFTRWWEADAVNRQITQVLRVLQPMQRQMARQTDVFTARVLSIMIGRVVRPAGVINIAQLRQKIPASLVEDLANDRVTSPYLELGDNVDGPNGHINDVFDPLVPRAAAEFAAPADVYGRIADGVRFDMVANGLEEPAARQRALVRLQAAAHTDVTLAVRAQYEKALNEGRTVRADGWRRILRPELSESGPCGLCVVAADRIYNRGDLLPIHDRCVCEVLPIIGGLDPGLLLNRDDLRRLYAAAGSTGGSKREGGALKAIRVALAEHGELGPVLVNAGQNFRGMKQVAKTQSTDRRHRLEAELVSLERSFDMLIRRRAAGEHVDRPYEWQSHRIDKLRGELAALV